MDNKVAINPFVTPRVPDYGFGGWLIVLCQTLSGDGEVQCVYSGSGLVGDRLGDRLGKAVGQGDGLGPEPRARSNSWPRRRFKSK